MASGMEVEVVLTIFWEESQLKILRSPSINGSNCVQGGLQNEALNIDLLGAFCLKGLPDRQYPDQIQSVRYTSSFLPTL